MPKSQGPQTFKKRQRERMVQEKHLAKIARRNELNAKKREAKLNPPPAAAVESTQVIQDPTSEQPKESNHDQRDHH
jgi:hypothetical protein